MEAPGNIKKRSLEEMTKIYKAVRTIDWKNGKTIEKNNFEYKLITLGIGIIIPKKLIGSKINYGANTEKYSFFKKAKNYFSKLF